MSLFIQLERDGAPVVVEVGATYYFPGNGWLVRAYHNHAHGFDSVEGRGATLEAALQDLKANWIKSGWYTGAPAPKVSEIP
jgi:hypothetical protein